MSRDLQKPAVSVVIPSYNQDKYLAAAVDSAFGQTYPSLEVIVCDDCSTDQSAAVLDALQVRYGDRLRVLRNSRNEGVSRSRNRALASARGAYLAFLDADDLWEPTKIERQIALLERRPEIGVVFTAISPFAQGEADPSPWEDWNRLLEGPAPRGQVGFLWEALRGTPCCWSSVVVRREVAEAVGGFSTRLTYQAEDWLFLLCSIFVTDIAGVDASLTRYRVHPESYTSRVLLHYDARRMQSIRWEIRREFVRFAARRALAAGSGAERASLARLSNALLRWATSKGVKTARERLSTASQRAAPRLYHGLRRRIRAEPELEQVILFVTSACNLSCEFCFYADNLNTKRDMRHDDVLKLIDSMPRTRLVLLTGGEPFANKALDEIALRCLERADCVQINTNGTLYEQTKKLVRSILEAHDPARHGRFQISVSLDGLEATHNRVRQKDCFQDVLRTLRLLRRMRHTSGGAFALKVNSTLTSSNLHEIPPLMDFLAERFQLDGHSVELERKNPGSPSGAQASPEELRQAYTQVLGRMKHRYPSHHDRYRAVFSVQYLNKSTGQAWPYPCTAGVHSLVVYDDGEFGACEMLETVGSAAEFGYDLRRMLSSAGMRRRTTEIAAGRCFCTHGCWVGSSLRSAYRGRPLPVAGINPGVLSER